MSNLKRAIVRAEERKNSAFPEGTVGLQTGEFESRAIFGGFDIDHDELNNVSSMAGSLFHTASLQGDLGLRPLFSAAWTEGFLVGLMLGSLPPTESVGMDAPDSGGE